MGIFDRIFRNDDDAAHRPRPSGQAPGQAPGAGGQPLSDAQAIARYRYLLRTAPPEAVEEAHAEAFAQLTPAQRRAVLEELAAEGGAGARLADQADDDPRALARMATRAELRRPGTMERLFGRGRGMGGFGGGGLGMGGLLGGSFLGSMAGMVVGGAIAESLFGHGFGHDAHDARFDDAGATAADQGDTGDALADAGDTGDAYDAGGAGDDLAYDGDAGFDDLGSDELL